MEKISELKSTHNLSPLPHAGLCPLASQQELPLGWMRGEKARHPSKNGGEVCVVSPTLGVEPAPWHLTEETADLGLRLGPRSTSSSLCNLGIFTNLSKPQFPHLKNGAHCTNLQGMLEGVNM